MFYVYVLESEDQQHYYVGSTNDLQRRLEEHAQGKALSTRGKRWHMHWYCASPSRTTARNFEKYLKSGSGRAFAKRHFEFQNDVATTSEAKA